MSNLRCEVCNNEPSVGVACIPGVPMSAAFGERCLAAGAIPYWAAVANTACCGGFSKTAEWWDEVVWATLRHLNISFATFTLDVYAELAQMDEEFERQFDLQMQEELSHSGEGRPATPLDQSVAGKPTKEI